MLHFYPRNIIKNHVYRFGYRLKVSIFNFITYLQKSGIFVYKLLKTFVDCKNTEILDKGCTAITVNLIEILFRYLLLELHEF